MARKETITKSNANFSVIGPGIAGRKVQVASYKVPDNTAVGIPNGAQLIMKLADSTGAEISRDAYVYFYLKRSGFDGEEFFAKIPYSTFYDLAIGDQRNEKYRDQTRLNFAVPKPGVVLGPGDELQVWIEAAEAVDFTNAATIFELEVQVKAV